MATIFKILDGTYQGRLDIGPEAIPHGLNNLSLEVECSQWTDTTSSATVTLHISYDGGQSWGLLTNANFRGGAVDSQGNPKTIQRLSMFLRDGQLQIKGSIQVHGTLNTHHIHLVCNGRGEGR